MHTVRAYEMSATVSSDATVPVSVLSVCVSVAKISFKKNLNTSKPFWAPTLRGKIVKTFS